VFGVLSVVYAGLTSEGSESPFLTKGDHKAEITHNEIIKQCKRVSLFHCLDHTTPKCFNDIVAITAVIVFLAVIAILSMISLCVIAASIIL